MWLGTKKMGKTNLFTQEKGQSRDRKKIEIVDTPKTGSLERSTNLAKVCYTEGMKKANTGLESWPEQSARREKKNNSGSHERSNFVARH